jgi:hypothetical protein
VADVLLIARLAGARPLSRGGSERLASGTVSETSPTDHDGGGLVAVQWSGRKL